MKNPARVTTGVVRLIFTALEEPRENKNGKLKYSVRMAIPKEDKETLDILRGGIQAAYENGEAVLKGKGKTVPELSRLDDPIHDGDIERPDDPACEGMFYLNASTDFEPGFFDTDLNEIPAANLYSGCMARVCVTFFAYNVTGGRGIACGLNSLQFIADNEPLFVKNDPKLDFA